MTGFGRAEAGDERTTVRVEVRSLNNRHLRIVPRVPEQLQGLEPLIEQLVAETLHRGTVYVAVDVVQAAGMMEYEIDADTLRAYVRQLGALSHELSMVGGEVRLESLLGLPGCVRRSKDAALAPEARLQVASQALRKALAAVVEMRDKEGQTIWQDFLKGKRRIDDILGQVEQRQPAVLQGYRDRLAARVQQLVGDMKISEADLHRELAIFAERSDISEEISRLHSHLAQLDQIPSEDGKEPAGRKLEFIVQEMLREANTMAAKANDAQVVQLAVLIKVEIDKMREQALNVE